MNETRLYRLMQWATILGAFVTAVSVIFGVLTYRRGAHEQRQAAAIAILQDYLKLSVEHPDLASRKAGAPIDEEYTWFATHALFTAETLWGLVGEERKWQSTIRFVLRQHRDYLSQGVLSCDAYQEEFLDYARSVETQMKCRE